jgi:ubiquinone biosynthesis protein UbiJ
MSTRVGPDESAVETLCQAVGKLTAKVDGLREKLEELERKMRKKALKTAEMYSGDTLN